MASQTPDHDASAPLVEPEGPLEQGIVVRNLFYPEQSMIVPASALGLRRAPRPRSSVRHVGVPLREDPQPETSRAVPVRRGPHERSEDDILGGDEKRLKMKPISPPTPPTTSMIPTPVFKTRPAGSQDPLPPRAKRTGRMDRAAAPTAQAPVMEQPEPFKKQQTADLSPPGDTPTQGVHAAAQQGPTSSSTPTKSSSTTTKVVLPPPESPSVSTASSSSEGQQDTHSSGSVYTDVEHRGDSDTKSTSYAALESVPMDAAPLPSPPSPPPEAAASYAAALRTTPPPRSPTPPTQTRQATQGETRSSPPTTHALKGYPPIIVESMTKWPTHFAELRKRLGYPPNARAFDKGVRFTPHSADEFRIVQRYLTEAASTDTKLSWWCYSVASERPQKAAIRGLPIDTDPEDIVAALQSQNFKATSARLIPTRSLTRPGLYHVVLEPMTKDELGRLFATTELLNMPGISIETWRGHTRVAQCHRCQGYGHSSVNCHRPAKCVRCGGPHFAAQCDMKEGATPTCANCQGKHTANSRACPVYRNEARRRNIKVPGPHLPPPNADQRPPRGYRAALPQARPGRRTAPAQPRTMQQPPQMWQPVQPSYQRGAATLQPPANPATRRGTPLEQTTASRKTVRRRQVRQRVKQREHPQQLPPVAASTPLPRYHQHPHAFAPFAPQWRPNAAPLIMPMARPAGPSLAPAMPFNIPGTNAALGMYVRQTPPFAFAHGQAPGSQPSSHPSSRRSSRGRRRRRRKSRPRNDLVEQERVSTATLPPQATTTTTVTRDPGLQRRPPTTAAPTTQTATVTTTTATTRPEPQPIEGAPHVQRAPHQEQARLDPRRHFVPVTQTQHTAQWPRDVRQMPMPYVTPQAAPWQQQHHHQAFGSTAFASGPRMQQRATQAPPPGFYAQTAQQPRFPQSTRDPMYAILGILVDLLSTIAAGGELREAAMRGLASINGCLNG